MRPSRECVRISSAYRAPHIAEGEKPTPQSSYFGAHREKREIWIRNCSPPLGEIGLLLDKALVLTISQQTIFVPCIFLKIYPVPKYST
jgi:hypothetical protein